MTIVCLYCHKPHDVARKAVSLTCKHCHKPLSLLDVTVKEYRGVQVIDTLGIVTVEKRGHVVVTKQITCGGLVARGKIKGAIHSRGAVLVGPEAEIKGDVTAPSIAIGAGAILEGRYEIGDVASLRQTPSAG